MSDPDGLNELKTHLLNLWGIEDEKKEVAEKEKSIDEIEQEDKKDKENDEKKNDSDEIPEDVKEETKENKALYENIEGNEGTEMTSEYADKKDETNERVFEDERSNLKGEDENENAMQKRTEDSEEIGSEKENLSTVLDEHSFFDFAEKDASNESNKQEIEQNSEPHASESVSVQVNEKGDAKEIEKTGTRDVIDASTLGEEEGKEEYYRRLSERQSDLVEKLQKENKYYKWLLEEGSLRFADKTQMPPSETNTKQSTETSNQNSLSESTNFPLVRNDAQSTEHHDKRNNDEHLQNEQEENDVTKRRRIDPFP